MNIGSFRHRISLHYINQREVPNEPSTSTQKPLIKYLWAKIESLSGLMQYDSKQIGDELTHKITIRFLTGISSQNWLEYFDPTRDVIREFEIKNIKNIDERNQYLELLVKEVYSTDNNVFRAGHGKAGDPLED